MFWRCCHDSNSLKGQIKDKLNDQTSSWRSFKPAWLRPLRPSQKVAKMLLRNSTTASPHKKFLSVLANRDQIRNWCWPNRKMPLTPIDCHMHWDTAESLLGLEKQDLASLLVRVRYQVCIEATRTVVTALIRIHHDPTNRDPSWPIKKQNSSLSSPRHLTLMNEQ